MNDALLKPFLNATTDKEAELHLQKLYESHLQPVVRPILWSILRKQFDSHDIHDMTLDTEANVIAVLFPRIRKVRSHPIPNLPGYTARVAYHCAFHCLEQKFPLRASTQNSLKVILKNTNGLSLWENRDHRPICGFTVWKEKGKERGQSERLTRALDDAAEFSLQAFPHDNPQHIHPALLLKNIFDWFGHPIFFADAVTLFMSLRGVISESSLSLDAIIEQGFEPVATDKDPLHLLQTQAGIQRIWQHLCCLRPKQRASLLLDWKEIPESPVQLFLLKGALPLAAIANVLELTPKRLSEILMSLPWEDTQIAEQLGTTEGTVRNLRSSGSKKLQEQLRDI